MEEFLENLIHFSMYGSTAKLFAIFWIEHFVISIIILSPLLSPKHVGEQPELDFCHWTEFIITYCVYVLQYQIKMILNCSNLQTEFAAAFIHAQSQQNLIYIHKLIIIIKLYVWTCVDFHKRMFRLQLSRSMLITMIIGICQCIFCVIWSDCQLEGQHGTKMEGQHDAKMGRQHGTNKYVLLWSSLAGLRAMLGLLIVEYESEIIWNIWSCPHVRNHFTIWLRNWHLTMTESSVLPMMSVKIAYISISQIAWVHKMVSFQTG